MNVALLVGRFGPGTGTGGVGWRLAHGLLDRGHRVEVWTGRVDRAAPELPIHPLGSRWTAASRVTPGFIRVALDRVPGCEVARASGGVHALWAAIRGIRLSVRDVRETWLDRATARTARLVVCNALKTAGDVMAWHGIPAARIRLVTTTPEAPRHEVGGAALRARWGAQGRVALFVGHGYRRKNLSVAWQAFARVAAPADRLVVAGTDAHPERWLAPARRVLGAQLIVEAPENASALLAGADALVHPTLYDAASNVVLEALAAGVPPVVSLRDGAAERVTDRALVVANPRDVAAVAAALAHAWARPALSPWRPAVAMTEAWCAVLEEVCTMGSTR